MERTQQIPIEDKAIPNMIGGNQTTGSRYRKNMVIIINIPEKKNIYCASRIQSLSLGRPTWQFRHQENPSLPLTQAQLPNPSMAVPAPSLRSLHSNRATFSSSFLRHNKPCLPATTTTTTKPLTILAMAPRQKVHQHKHKPTSHSLTHSLQF